MEQLFFNIFALMTVVFAVGVISLKNPVHSAVSLIFCLLQVAAIYILLRAPFLAAVQVFIYVGAVMVLFLFAVMVLDIGRERVSAQIHGQAGYGLLSVAALSAKRNWVVTRGRVTAAPGPFTEDRLAENTEVVGRLLYTKYIFPFEVVSVLLLVALIGAVVLVLKKKE